MSSFARLPDNLLLTFNSSNGDAIGFPNLYFVRVDTFFEFGPLQLSQKGKFHHQTHKHVRVFPVLGGPCGRLGRTISQNSVSHLRSWVYCARVPKHTSFSSPFLLFHGAALFNKVGFGI